ncbi:hypothetical protein HDV03_001572, partial [Kappamyces sp. JEL0829]
MLVLEQGLGITTPLSHKLRVGDIVQLERSTAKKRATDLAGDWKASGVVTRIQEMSITLSCKDDLRDIPDLIKITKLANEISYKRMDDALDWLASQAETPSPLVQVLFGDAKPAFDSVDNLCFLDDSLNDPQRLAVRRCLEARELSLIHGPPGTGKTHTCVEVIRQLVSRGLKVLVCGPSNISVDNLAERLARCKLDMVRIGHPSRVLESVLSHALDVRIHSSNQGQIVADVRKELDNTFASMAKTKRRGDKHKLYLESKQLRQELKQRERIVLDETLRNAQVILCTLNGSASKILKSTKFDVLLIDEASQALEAESWIAISKAQKLLLAGDHKQLPPTIQCKDAKAERALSITLFERLLGVHGPSISVLLNVQYRMNEKIMRFSSDCFYGGKLICGPG